MKKSAWFGLLVLGGLVALGLKTPVTQAQTPPSQAPQAAIQKDIVYGEAGGQKLLLDIYGADAVISPTTVKRPAIIFVHGGSWSGGSKKDFGQAATIFAQQGYIGICVGYRLAKGGTNRYPAQIDDVQRAVRWVRAHAAEYGIDPDKIGALGGSAGGHLVALLGTMDTRDNSDAALASYSSRVQCVVDLFGPTDFTLALDAPVVVTPDEAKALKTLENFLGPLPEAKADYLEASPVTHVDKKSSPFLIFHGGKDAVVPASQSQILDAALREAGIESKLTIFPDQGHGFVGSALGQTFADSFGFFNRHLKQAPAAN